MELSPQRKSALIAVLVAGAFYMENLDATVIATALPQMARSFHTSPINLSAGMSAYMVALAVFIPISGWVADRVGSRTVFGTAVGVFTFASVLCGFSHTSTFFTAARVLQGMGGAMMVPVGRLVVLRNTEKKDLMRAIAYLTWPGLLAPVIGPPLGGFITTYASWRWIFLLNVPLGILAIILTTIFIPNEHGNDGVALDVRGFFLSGGAVVTMMYGLDMIGRQDAPWLRAGVFIACGIVLGILTVRHSNHHPAPMLEFSALKIPTFGVMIYGGSLFRIAIYSVPFLLPLMFQVGFGLSAFTSGLLVLAVFAGNVAMKPLTTPILRRLGFRSALLANGIVVVATILVCAFLSPTTPRWFIMAALFCGGLCRSMQFTSLNTIGFADVPKSMLSGANALFSTMWQLNVGLGIAFGAIALQLAVLLRGDTGRIQVADFHLAFVFVTLIVVLPLIEYLRLDKNAGAVVSGHATAPEPEPAAEPAE
jgi:EmrB/QacA subfamily drug resistance transporter